MRPDTFGVDWLSRLFFELSTCRGIGMGGAGPIPATAIWQAVDRFGLPDWAVDAIFSIDAAWLARQRKSAPEAGE